jgi:gentisate 1,2-dioxygenase
MKNTAEHHAGSQEAEFRESLAERSLRPLWDVLHMLVPREPATPAIPAHWSYRDVSPWLYRAGELITAEQAERRVLILENPAMRGQSRITSTLYAGLQLVLPGEIARCHRHTQAALRFIVEGNSAFTAVDGERLHMHRWDLILTPSWSWHDHGNETSDRIVWLDGLDIPLVTALDAGFSELLGEGDLKVHHTTRPPGNNVARFGANMRPARGVVGAGEGPSGLLIYPYADWRPALGAALMRDRVDRHDGIRMEFTNPASGGSVMNTIAAFVQLIPAGFETQGVKSTDGSVHVVVEGQGTVEIGGTSYRLAESDIFVVPAWAERKFQARQDLVLFSFSDKAAQERLGLWREHLA